MTTTTSQEIIEQKPRRGYWSCLHGGIALLILAIPVWYFCLYSPPLRISEETAYVLDPLTADGKQIDYFRDFEEMSYPAAITPPTTIPITPVKPLAKLSEGFERDVHNYEEASKASPPEPGCTLFVGSSSFALWGKKLEEAFADRNAVNRGFGGSTFPDNLLAIDRIHIPCRPARVVIFCGTNDLAHGASVDEVFANFRQYLARLWDADPRIEVFFVSITHAPAREHLWAKGDALIAMIQEIASNNSELTVIDIITPMNAAIERGEELFVSDQLHLNDAGYAIWTQAFCEAFAAQDAHNAKRNTPANPSE